MARRQWELQSSGTCNPVGVSDTQSRVGVLK